jgi:hypothetical protein
MKRHPSRKLIECIILRGENVQETLDKYELPPAKVEYINKLRRELVKPEGFVIDQTHEESVKYLKDLNIFNLVFPDKYTYEAFSLLGTVHIREDLEKLLLSREKPEKIAKNLNTKFESTISPKAIERYGHYFYNTKEMRMEDWSLIFDNNKDKRTNMNILRAGPDYARYVLGFVQKAQIRQTMEEVANIMHYDLQALRFKPESSEKTKDLATMASTLMKLEEKLNTNATSIQNDIAIFERVRVAHLKADIPTIEDFARLGNYTGSGQELKEIEKESTIIDLDDE